MISSIKYFLFLILKKSILLFSDKRKNQKERYLKLKKTVPEFFKKIVSSNKLDKKLLIYTIHAHDLTDLFYAKTLEKLGYETHILTGYFPFMKKIFSLFGIKNVHCVQKLKYRFSKKKIKKETKKLLSSVKTKDELLNLSINDVKIGKYAVSWALRLTRNANIDFNDKNILDIIFKEIVNSIIALKVAESVYEKIKPDLLFLIERGYTPYGQLYDVCINNGVNVIQRCAAQKSGFDVIKRYSSQEMSSIHHQTLSNESWEYIKNMKWSDHHWKNLYEDLYNTYVSGDWFSEVGTQFNKKVYSKNELISKLDIDKTKKVAAVFPHMFWDATFFWGVDIFKDYYDWFVNVLRLAAENKNLNWLVKIHPANIVKAKRDNFKGEHNEIIAIRETLGDLPDHIKIIPSETDINTFSLFSIMDYCLTVRGTIGIESALFGINTITAGTGRYDKLGFTYDFDNKDDYINFIKNLHNIKPMTNNKIELARRFAYGIFLIRPIKLDLLQHYYTMDEKAKVRSTPLFNTIDEFESSSFVNEFRSFISSEKEDYLSKKIKL